MSKYKYKYKVRHSDIDNLGILIIKLKSNDTFRTLTLINRASLVVYIECLVGNECKHKLLFTGDADGGDVIKALEREKLLLKTS